MEETEGRLFLAAPRFEFEGLDCFQMRMPVVFMVKYCSISNKEKNEARAKNVLHIFHWRTDPPSTSLRWCKRASPWTTERAGPLNALPHIKRHMSIAPQKTNLPQKRKTVSFHHTDSPYRPIRMFLPSRGRGARGEARAMTRLSPKNGNRNIYTTRPHNPGPSVADWSLKIGNPSGPFQFLMDSRSWMIESKMISSKNRHPCWHSTADSIRSLAKRRKVSLR